MGIGVVGSCSPIKLKVIKESLKQMMPDEDWDIVGVPARSGMPEQPLNNETLEGAMRRAHEASQWVSNYDVVIAIESGLFTQTDGTYLDKGIVYCLTKEGKSYIYESDAIEFPKDCVEEARRRGFETCTAGMIMQERGIVTNHKDPHISLTHGQRGRADYIKSAVLKLCEEVLQSQQVTSSCSL